MIQILNDIGHVFRPRRRSGTGEAKCDVFVAKKSKEKNQYCKKAFTLLLSLVCGVGLMFAVPLSYKGSTPENNSTVSSFNDPLKSAYLIDY